MRRARATGTLRRSVFATYLRIGRNTHTPPMGATLGNRASRSICDGRRTYHRRFLGEHLTKGEETPITTYYRRENQAVSLQLLRMKQPHASIW